MALELEHLITGQKQVNILGSITGSFNKNSFSIQFGIGRGISRGGSSYSRFREAASPIPYSSFVAPSRTREEDIKLVDRLISDLSVAFPLLQTDNDIVQTGSTHEVFAGDVLAIHDQSITQEAARLSVSR